ncbi:MAG: sigma factor [Acidobacteriota bacterium]
MIDTVKDEYLLEEARNGDQIAFLLLYQRHGNAIFHFLNRFRGSAEIAEDITHDCFLSLIKGSEKSESSAPVPLRIGLYSTARTLAMEYSRKSGQARVEKDSVQVDSSSSGNKPINASQDSRLPSGAGEAVASLPTVEREALILSEY